MAIPQAMAQGSGHPAFVAKIGNQVGLLQVELIHLETDDSYGTGQDNGKMLVFVDSKEVYQQFKLFGCTCG